MNYVAAHERHEDWISLGQIEDRLEQLELECEELQAVNEQLQARNEDLVHCIYPKVAQHARSD